MLLHRFRHSTALPACAVAAIIVILLPLLAIAGPSQPGRRGGGDNRRSGGGQQTKPEVRDADPEGTLSGFIQKFTPSKEGDDEKLLGYLTFKPEDETIKTIKMAVYKEDVKISLGELSFTPEEAGDYLANKGLYCRVTWQGNRAFNSKIRELMDLAIQTIEISGEVETSGDDLMVIKARPLDGDWPGADSAANVKSTGNKPIQPPAKKLNLKVLDNVSKFSDASDNATDASEFGAKMSIHATIVYSKPKEGIIVSLRPPGAKRATGITPTDNGGAPPPPRNKGGRKPVGGG